MEKYIQLQKKATDLKHELMDIDEYSEEIYQAVDNLIDELDYLIRQNGDNKIV